MGYVNSYNASSGPLAITLQALSGTNPGAYCIIEKNIADGTFNTVTFTATGADTFTDGSTSYVLYVPGDQITLQCVAISGTNYWKVVGRDFLQRGLTAITSEVSVSNTGTLTALVSETLPVGVLYAGATFRIVVDGTVQTNTTSGTLTFTTNIQGTALAQTAQMASQSALGPVAFHLESVASIRTTGTSGTAICKPYGWINFATLLNLSSTSTSTTTVNTTSGASSTVLSLSAQWASALTNNILKIETAYIERII